MLLAPDIITILKAHQAILTSEYYIKTIGLFGSYARGVHIPDSDIDFVMEFDDECQDPYETMYQRRLYLSGSLQRNVDTASLKTFKHYEFREITNHSTYPR